MTLVQKSFPIIAVCSFVVLKILKAFIFVDSLSPGVSVLIDLSLLLIAFFVFDFKNVVRIQNGKIIEGYYNRLLGFVKIKNEISMSDILEIGLVQNDEKYFEIKIFTSYNEIKLKKNPNRIPAEKELEEFKSKIKNIS